MKDAFVSINIYDHVDATFKDTAAGHITICHMFHCNVMWWHLKWVVNCFQTRVKPASIRDDAPIKKRAKHVAITFQNGLLFTCIFILFIMQLKVILMFIIDRILQFQCYFIFGAQKSFSRYESKMYCNKFEVLWNISISLHSSFVQIQ